jgi:hypothetical protein
MLDFDWGRVPADHPNERLSRKLIHGEKIMVAQIFLRRGCVVPEHRHESEQMTLVMSGSLRFQLGTEEKIVGSGQAMNRLTRNIQWSRWKTRLRTIFFRPFGTTGWQETTPICASDA